MNDSASEPTSAAQVGVLQDRDRCIRLGIEFDVSCIVDHEHSQFAAQYLDRFFKMQNFCHGRLDIILAIESGYR